MQILFAVLMGLRRGEINGLKYSDVAPKMLTKQDIPVKTDSSVRELPIPDFVFEAIL